MNVSPQNVLEILDAANSMQISDMKSYALELIVQNFAQVIYVPLTAIFKYHLSIRIM